MHLHKRLSLRLLVFISAALTIVSLLFFHLVPKVSEGAQPNQSIPPSNPQQKGAEALRKDLIEAALKMVKAPCDIKGLSNYDQQVGADIRAGLQQDGEVKATSEQLRKYLQVETSDVRTLRNLHETIVNLIPAKLKEGEYKGRGIVMTGDGIYFPSALTAIRWIRNRGYQIPIELYIPHKYSWESSCDNLLPSMNVTCKCLEELYGESFKAFSGSGGFAYKALSIMMSDFDEIYYTDTDSLPLVDVEDYFDEPLFQKYGFLFNSDYWPRVTSPFFYDIVNVTLGPDQYGTGQKLRQIDRDNAISGWATESGQFFVKKSLHFRSLLLSLYYNVKGSIWYPLLTQGAPGEGDKEVWPAAAQVLGEPWYQTHTKPVKTGYPEDGGVHGFCMMQPDFLTDYELYIHGRQDLPPKFIAAHFNMLKLNVQRTLGENNGAIPQGRFLGKLSDFQRVTNISGDIELEIWTAARDSACNWAVDKGLVPKNWGAASSASRYCDALRRRVEFLIETPEVSTPPDVKP